MDGCMKGWMNGWKDGWMDERIDGWMKDLFIMLLGPLQLAQQV